MLQEGVGGSFLLSVMLWLPGLGVPVQVYVGEGEDSSLASLVYSCHGQSPPMTPFFFFQHLAGITIIQIVFFCLSRKNLDVDSIFILLVIIISYS